jgi:hypothetical protein
MNMFHAISRWIEVTGGLALLYMRFCLYETEEGALQDAIALLWLQVVEVSESTKSRLNKLLRETARISAILLDLVFGPTILSVKAALVATSLSISSAGLLLGTLWEFDAVPFWTGLLGLAVALAPAVISRPWTFWIPAAFIAVIAISTSLEVVSSTDVNFLGLTSLAAAEGMGGAAVVALVIDFFWLGIVRWGVDATSNRNGLLLQSTMIITCSLLGVGSFILLPPTIEGVNDWWNDALNSWSISTMMICLGASRLYVALASLTQLIVLLVALVHWVIWPVLSRLVYAAERYKFFKERKLFGTCGTALIVHASGGATWLIEAIKSLKLGE